MTYFYSSFLFAALAVVAAYLLGGASAVFIVLVLAVLETSLSFDNAVVNASVLSSWGVWWRRAFLWVGLPIAVFGMRLFFPVLIVAYASALSVGDAFRLALTDAPAYASVLQRVAHEIAAFGGMFLLMVSFEFFIDEEKKHHWLPGIEPMLAALGTYQKAVGVGLALAVLASVSALVPAGEQAAFLVAGIYGLLVYIGVKFLGQLLGGRGTSSTRVAEGVGGFLYLELLDASFSFDGVVGAFAITNNLMLIVLGLAVGAFFVRSFTLYLTERGVLTQYQYLEHGAFWAIFALALIMLIKVEFEVPEVVTGLIGACLIGLSMWSSARSARAHL